MHLQNLPTEDAERVATLLKAYLPHQHAILTGVVDPIGEEPCGAGWTGFCSRQPTETGRGYLLLLREANDRPTARLTIPGTHARARLMLQRLAGDGRQRQITLAADGTGRFRLPRPRSYALYQWRLADEPN
jgi:hypothetical protein